MRRGMRGLPCLIGRFVVFAAALALPLASGSARAQQAGVPKFDIAALRIVGVTLMPIGGKPKVGVGLANPTDASIWVRVTLEAPGPVQCGGGRTELPPKQRIWVVCPVDEIVPERDYPVGIAIYLDDKLAEGAGTRQVKARFRKQDVEWLQAQLKPPAFPQSMANVVYSETATALHAFGTVLGALVVDEGGLKYSDKDRTINIASAQMRSVTPKIDRQHWMITVEYRDGTEDKTAVFQRSYFSGGHAGIDEFVRALVFVFGDRQK